MLPALRVLGGRLARPALQSQQQGLLYQGVRGQQRWMSASLEESGPESHDDFKPRVAAPESVLSVHEHIEKDIKENPVVVYMKGVPDAPQCGFSAMVVRILDHYGVDFKARNVLADQELREGIKTYSQWPTVPQVYMNGEFVGGCDIIMSMQKTGELKSKLDELNLSKVAQ